MIIKTKIITIVALTILLTVGITTTLLIKIQGDKMINAKLEDTEFLGDIIVRSVENAMVSSNTQEVQKIIENLGRNREIVTLRIISDEGIILKSKDSSEISMKLSDFTNATLNRTGKKPELINEKTINYYKAIPNKKDCFTCHRTEGPFIGMLQIRQDISRNYSTVLSLKRLLVFANISIILIVSIILSYIFSRFVMTPLKDLLSTIHNVEAGNWQATATVNSNDELGLIGASFNKMIEEVNKLYKKSIAKERELSKIKIDLEHKNKVEGLNLQLELKIKELETANKAITSLSREVKGKNLELEKAVERLKQINEIGRILTSIIETDELMKIIIRTTADLLSAKQVTMHLMDDQKPSAMTIRYQHGIGIEDLSADSHASGFFYDNLVQLEKPSFFTLPSTVSSENSKSLRNQICVPLQIKGKLIGAMLIENKIDGNVFTEGELDLLTILSNQAIVAMENAWLYEHVKSNYFSTIQSLVAALEANDKFTSGHSERVKILSLELGRYIGLDLKELEILEHASILHDIGKIGIDNVVLQKQGKLTSKEYKLIQSHPEIGDEILGPIESLEGVRKTIIQHHERYDGKGYPYGLKGEEISLKSRILAVIDTFDAMMTDRPYRKALTFEKVKEELLTNTGTQFDPYVVNAFFELLNSRREDYLTELGYSVFQTTL